MKTHRHPAVGLSRQLFRLALLALCAVPVYAAEIRIRYISADRVYLDAGREAGLATDDVLHVPDGERVKVVLKVVSVTASTASCTIVEQTAAPKIGDLVVMVEKSAPDEAAPEPEPETEAEPESVTETRPSRIAAKKPDRSPLSGTVSAQYYSYDDRLGDNDFQQPGLRLKLRAENLFGGDYSIRIKTRTRYLSRDGDGQERQSATEWRNRIYEASFRYENENALINYRLGRIISNAFSGVGYIDGGLLQLNLTEHGHAGVFAGTQPEWQYSDLQTSITKYGAYYHYKKGDYTKGRFESTLALSGQYHGSTTNREYAYIRNLYQVGSRLYLFQSAEIDINRDWRKEKAGESLALSNLYAFARLRINERLKVGLAYDNRQNYYTYELRNRDERFFDDNARSGYRADFHARISDHMRLSGRYGSRTREGDDRDASNYNLNFYHRKFFLKGLSLNLRLSGFDNGVTEGESPTVRLGKRFKNGDSLSLGFSSYQYTFIQTGVERESQWLRLEGYKMLGRRLFLTGDLEFNDGDDAEGYRLFLELGYRL